jgi:hypothetical protein
VIVSVSDFVKKLKLTSRPLPEHNTTRTASPLPLGTGEANYSNVTQAPKFADVSSLPSFAKECPC